jgi:HSP20 family protein
MPNITEKFDQYAKDFFEEALFEKDFDFYFPIEITENENSYEMRAELPGIETSDIQLYLEDNCLIIEGVKNHYQSGLENIIISECNYGKFYRWIPLKEDVDNESVNATMSQGLLTISLLKKQDGLDDYQKIKVIKS